MAEESSEVPESINGGVSVDYQVMLDEAKASREAFEARLEPTAETDAFKEAIAAPEMIEDEESGVTFAAYRLNRDMEGTPLVINLAWSVPAESGVGRADLNEMAGHIDRPIIVIDMEATGKSGIPERAQRKDTTFESLAASHLRVIDKLGIDKFDIAGYSLGGVMAAGIAAQAGERVGNVVTMAAPGFEDISLIELGKGFVIKEATNSKIYRTEAAEFRPTIGEQNAAAEAATSGTINRKNVPMLLKLAKLMTQEATAEAIAELDPGTKWTDIVGSKDAVTDWTGHLEAARSRNAETPHSSSVYIMGSETHSVGIHRPAMAEIVASSLK